MLIKKYSLNIITELQKNRLSQIKTNYGFTLKISYNNSNFERI